MTKKEKKNRIIAYFLIGLIYLIAFFCIILCNWAKNTFDVTIESALFTITNPMKGANNDSVKEAVIYCLPRLIIFVAIIATICIIDYKNKTKITMTTRFRKREKTIDFNRFLRRCVAWCSVFAIVFSLAYADSSFEISKYFIARLHNSTIYEEYYVNPDDVNIVLSDSETTGKNLIHIYLESMETVYSSTAEGGASGQFYSKPYELR